MGLAATLLVVLLGVIVVGIAALYIFFLKKFEYWKKKNVRHAQPSFPFGNVGTSGRSEDIGTMFRRLYNQFPGEPYVGIWVLHRPTLLIRDLELIKTMLVRDFMSFHDRGTYYNEEKDPLSASLASLKGAQWRNVRVKLTPTFTSGKIKSILPILVDCSKKLQEALHRQAEERSIVDFKDITARFATDVISSVAFGIESYSLENPKSIFREMGRKVFAPTWSVNIKNSIAFFLPDIAEYLELVVTPNDVTNFFLGVFKETVEYRKKNSIQRNDFLQLLIQLIEKGYIEDADAEDKFKNLNETNKFTIEQAASQAFIFLVGGFETTSTTIQFAVYELAKNPEIQRLVREEITRVLEIHNGEITYEAVQQMGYLSRAVDETLRMYPPGSALTRICTKDFVLPGTDTRIEEGTTVVLPIYGIHMDPAYFPDPQRFDPDRFTEDNIRSRPNFCYLPFGEGPRLCIGQRFALLQVKIGLIGLLTKYQVSVTKKTPIPMKFNPRSFIFDVEGGMNLQISALQNKN